MDIIGKLVPSIIPLVGILVGWYLKDKSEKLRLQKEGLSDKKKENYLKIVNPLIRMFSGVENDIEMKKALKDVRSFEYRKTAFELMLFGSDSAVKAYNDYFQYLYKEEDNLDAAETFRKLGKVFLEIRKDLGNIKTDLKELDMLRFMIKDIDHLQ